MTTRSGANKKSVGQLGVCCPTLVIVESQLSAEELYNPLLGSD
jgi:hypothetical protein